MFSKPLTLYETGGFSYMQSWLNWYSIGPEKLIFFRFGRLSCEIIDQPSELPVVSDQLLVKRMLAAGILGEHRKERGTGRCTEGGNG